MLSYIVGWRMFGLERLVGQPEQNRRGNRLGVVSAWDIRTPTMYDSMYYDLPTVDDSVFYLLQHSDGIGLVWRLELWLDPWASKQ